VRFDGHDAARKGRMHASRKGYAPQGTDAQA